jgi:hypothetical protein
MIGGARHGRPVGRKWAWEALRCVKTPNATRRGREGRNGGGGAFVGDARCAKWSVVRRWRRAKRLDSLLHGDGAAAVGDDGYDASSNKSPKKTK